MIRSKYINFYVLTVSLLVVFTCGVSAGGQAENSSLSTVLNPVALKRVVLFPFANYTDDPVAGTAVTEVVRAQMQEKGYFVFDEDVVDAFLAKRRIRQTSTVTSLTAREIGKELDADAVMVGGTDIYERGSEVIVGMTVRLVNTLDGSIIWAEHLSCSGWDTEGLLGLGVIDSIEKLTSKTTRELLSTVPKVFSGVRSVRPFEAASVNVFPSVARSGDRVNLRVKMTPITGSPVMVKAKIGNEEVSLVEDGSGYYEGRVDAPSGEGIYPVDVIAYDKEMKPFPFNSFAKLSILNVAPQVALFIDKKAIAPQRKDFVLFSPKLKDLAPIDEWRIEILNSEGGVVRNDGGFGRLPNKLVWKGDSNSSSMVEDGEYRVHFSVIDAAGNRSVLKDTIRVKNRPPQVEIDAKLINGKLVFTFALPAKDEVIDVWEVAIYDNKGGLLETFNGKGDMPSKLEYFVKEGYDLNSISFSVTVTDDVGNPFQFKKALKTFAFKDAPFAKVDQKEQSLFDF